MAFDFGVTARGLDGRYRSMKSRLATLGKRETNVPTARQLALSSRDLGAHLRAGANFPKRAPVPSGVTLSRCDKRLPRTPVQPIAAVESGRSREVWPQARAGAVRRARDQSAPPRKKWGRLCRRPQADDPSGQTAPLIPPIAARAESMQQASVLQSIFRSAAYASRPRGPRPHARYGFCVRSARRRPGRTAQWRQRARTPNTCTRATVVHLPNPPGTARAERHAARTAHRGRCCARPLSPARRPSAPRHPPTLRRCRSRTC